MLPLIRSRIASSVSVGELVRSAVTTLGTPDFASASMPVADTI